MNVVACQVPSGRAAMAERISRSAWSLAASPAASTVPEPWRSCRATNRSAPIREAAIWASMSPTTRSDARMLSRRSCQTGSILRPSSYTLIDLNWSPSA